jgi:hypothetical protein
MSFSGANPGIWGVAVVTGLLTGQNRAAREHHSSAERSELDVAELRGLERAEFYGEAPVIPGRYRNMLDRLLHTRLRHAP